ncbi:MAG TPA: ABC transporter ATP-binding protein [Polyangia bacterium]|nr:ABC transporter ATP-binding protein [Polyangia bacterium]
MTADQLEIRQVGKRLGGKKVLVDVNLRCVAAEIALVAGANGSGKSTLLRVMVGLLEADHGSVMVRGHPVASVDGRRQLGYVPDTTDLLPELSVQEFVSLVQTLKQAQTPAGLRESLGLAETWRQRLRTLSFGQRKRVCLLAALIGDPWLLVLDEPTNGLDADGCALMTRLVVDRQRQGLATVVACNDATFIGTLGTMKATRYRIDAARLLPFDRPTAAP